jgi:hypothetical protein
MGAWKRLRRRSAGVWRICGTIAINTKSGTLWMTHSEAIVSTSLLLNASGHYGFLAFSG